MVSSKKGPSSGSGLSNSASTWSRPSITRPSSATSGPGTKSSTRTYRVQPPHAATSGCSRICWSRANAATNPGGSSARITPREGDSRGHDGGGVVHAGHAGDRVRPRELVRLLRRSLRVGEVERDEPVGLGLLEGAGQLGRDRELDTQAARRLHERRGAIGGGRKE